MSPSLTNGGFIHDLPCLQVVAHLGILHQPCNCPQGTEHGLQYPDQHSWHAVIFNYKYKKIKSFVSLYVKPQAVISHDIVTAVIFWQSLTIAKCIKFSII